MEGAFSNVHLLRCVFHAKWGTNAANLDADGVKGAERGTAPDPNRRVAVSSLAVECTVATEAQNR